MLSVIVYGRNDSYGYNLHRRAALSLNCISEMLTDKNDEIIFVDYNSPTNFPTFPEAIDDLLTAKCKSLLKIIKVNPKSHDQFVQGRTKLVTIEPLARNIGIRRMNKKNKWILSTNTDIIFTLNSGSSLSKLCAQLAPGYYSAPRFELPESVWESLDRKQPKKAINFIEAQSIPLHLEEVVHGDVWNLFDGPGDFQLFLASDAEKIRGFDETMIHGWHCDSNLNKRLSLIYEKPGDLSNVLKVYHCDHTRQITPLHSSKSSYNDPDEYVYDVTSSIANAKNSQWGMLERKFSCFSLNEKTKDDFVGICRETLGHFKLGVSSSTYTTEFFEKNDFPYGHVLLFLADYTRTLAPDAKIGWLGIRDEFFNGFVEIQTKLNSDSTISQVHSKNIDSFDAIIIHHPNLYKENPKAAEKFYAKIIRMFRRGKRERLSDILVIFTDVMHTRFSWVFNELFICAKTPYSARLMVGHYNPTVGHYNPTAVSPFRYKINILRNWILANKFKFPRVYKSAKFIYNLQKKLG